MGLCGVNRGVLSLLLAFDILVSVLVASAFAPTPSSTLSKRKLVDPNQEPRHSLSSGQEPEPDLFDYFDPLLSPHAYPDGISPGTKPIMDMKESNKVADKIDSFTRENRPALAEEPSLSSGQEPEPDLFDYFDPLLSPHAYPDGISPGTKPIMDMKESNKGTDKIDSFARENRPALAEEPEYNQELSSSGNSKPSGRGKIGVLLMDHGSRNEASNSRLQHLAKLYQLSLEEENIIVQHCHMEIASPSIAEGLEMLMNQGVDEIICHPYFLSPGRHVREDIPLIVNEAIKSLNIEIPVVTTNPVGSNTQLMIGAIHSLIRENSSVLRQQ